MEFIGPILPLFPITGNNASEAMNSFLPSIEERFSLENAREALERLRLSANIELDFILDNNPEIVKFVLLVSENLSQTIGPSNAAALRTGMLAFHRALTLQQVSSPEEIPHVTPESLNKYLKGKNATVVNDELVVFGDLPLEKMVAEFIESEPYAIESLDEFGFGTEHFTSIISGMSIMKDLLKADHVTKSVNS